MRIYILRRLLVAVPSLLIASLIVFTLPRLIPGDVVQLMLEEAYSRTWRISAAKLGLNRPIYVRVFRLDGLGGARPPGRVVVDAPARALGLARRLPVTVTLGIFATIVAIAIGMPIGVLAATRQDGATDFVAAAPPSPACPSRGSCWRFS
jgi:peptide/nickel transport system permease protein